MTQFKITIHCGNVNTVLFEDHESKDVALNHYANILSGPHMLRFGDILVNTDNITFVQAEEVIVKNLEEAETIEA